MKGTRLYYDKATLPDGSSIEMVIWRVPKPVPPTTHGLKYRLFRGFAGQRIVVYDNERGKKRRGRIVVNPYKSDTCNVILKQNNSG